MTAMIRANVPPHMLRWAIHRSHVPEEELRRRFDKLPEWLGEERRPTLKQLEAFAKKTHTPIGYLFLSEPPDEPVPIPDFRTVADRAVAYPSPNLLDTIYLCQQRQEWYRDYARSIGEEPLPFVRSVQTTDDITDSAARIRRTLGFDLAQRRRFRTWTEALRHFIGQADQLGVLVMVSGVVGSNTSRKLDPEEFRGFALTDPLAPLVFINGADTKSAQMFTLAHELAHLWLGESALSDATARIAPDHAVERWCNCVAAELLVPLEVMREAHDPGQPLCDALERLARQFKVSTLVILRRLHDAGFLDRERFWAAFDEERKRLIDLAAESKKKGSKGNYYPTTAARVSKRLARAVVVATWEGRSTFSEAYRLLGCRKTSTLRKLAHSVGVDV